MSHVTVGRWGNSLAIRVPSRIADAAGLTDGEGVDIEAVNGDIVIRRSTFNEQKRADALAAADEIIASSKNFTLGGLSIRDMIDDGRR